jgi:hypothetical protein
MTLFIGNPDISWKYTHRHNGKEFTVDSTELREALGEGNPFLEPALALGVREFIKTNIDELYQ